jgi:hypothetical protein
LTASINGFFLPEGGSGFLVGFVWKKEQKMLESIAVILIVLWLLGIVSSYTMGGFIHILLIVAVVVILLRVIQGRRVL